ncbi:MAG: DUF5698 domain-containing protein [Anaerolineae bacterium]|nr:DUF5698 domain-containing protein [Anaerolineae bacterium]
MVITLDGILLALMIFVLRVLNNAMGTVRIVIITRQQRLLAAVLAFIEALIFAVVIANVVKDLSNILNLTAYCGGFAVGSYVGMAIEARFITSYVTATVISPARGHDIAVALREKGFGVTETLGEGRDGTVTMLRSVFSRREVPELLTIVRDIQPDAFISVEEARAIQQGWVRNAREHRR